MPEKNKKIKKHTNAKSKLITFGLYMLISSAAGIIILVLLLCLFSSVLCVIDIPSFILVPITTFSICIAAIISALAFSYMCGERGIVCGFIMGIVLYVVLLISTLISGNTEFSSLSILKLAVIIVSGMVGGYLGINMREKVRRHH